MKTHTKYLTINTQERIQFVNVTDKIREVVEESGVQDGIVLINPMHITASVFMNIYMNR